MANRNRYQGKNSQAAAGEPPAPSMSVLSLQAVSSQGASLKTSGNTTMIPPLMQPKSKLEIPVKEITRTYQERKDKNKRDIVISRRGTTRNRVQIAEQILIHGRQKLVTTHNWANKHYNFHEELAKHTLEEKKRFLDKNDVDFIVDIDEVGGSGGDKHTSDSSIVDVLKTFDNSFNNNVKRLGINLQFPTVIPEAGETMIKLVKVDRKKIQESKAFKVLMELVVFLNENYTGLVSVSINLLVPKTPTTRLNITQLYYTMPFFPLSFTDWQIWYLHGGRSAKPLCICGGSLKYLTRNYNAMVREIAREKNTTGKQAKCIPPNTPSTVSATG